MKSELFSKFSKICFIFMILIYKQKFPKIQTIKTYFKDIPYSYYENYINDCYKLKKYRRKNK